MKPIRSILLVAMLWGYFYGYCFAQKPALDFNALTKWSTIDQPVISNDGNYIIYNIDNQAAGSTTLIIKDMHTKRQIAIPGAVDAAITQNSKFAVFLNSKDSLCIIKLGIFSPEYISNVASLRLFKQGTEECIAYELNTSVKELIIRHLNTGKNESFGSEKQYQLSKDGKVLLIEKGNIADDLKNSLVWINLSDGHKTIIWRGEKADNFVFDNSNTQLAFSVQDSAKKNSLWYYKAGSMGASMLANDNLSGIDSGLKIQSVTDFSQDGKRLFLKLIAINNESAPTSAVKVDIWSYRDEKLQSQQLKEIYPSSYLAVINIIDHSIIRLEHENETLSFFEGKSDDIAFITSRRGEIGEMFWNIKSRNQYYLIFTKNGQRKKVGMDVVGLDTGVSPDTKYLICTDDSYANLFSYEVGTGVIRNITQSLPIPQVDDIYQTKRTSLFRGLSVAASYGNGASVLLYDNYDIWKVDPTTKIAPICLTNGFGRKHNITFRLAGDYNAEYRTKPIEGNPDLFLQAFDRGTKKSGFYRLISGKKGNPEELTMGPYQYELCSAFPLKVNNAGLYMLKRSNASESPNYFLTRDFKTFKQLTSIYPERAYNWIKSELITWKSFDGTVLQGALYKPEDFDPSKKYPVIFYYYETMSDNLNEFKKPELSVGWMNIPWFVSHGYLVFTPDIAFKTGETGASAYNSIVSAAKYLSQFPFIDTKHMGLQAHSFGGFETNYLITHTDVFAGAMSSSGSSDLISIYGGLWGGGSSGQEYYEIGDGRIDHSLWQRPDLYIKNSPIFWADKVNTPLLMMNNKNDGAVPFAQGVEFYTGLRRLGKKVWMLEYDGEGHSLLDDKNSKDLTIRMTQFFDHYLKGAPAPKWMIEGIPAKMKGIDNGLALEPAGTEPGPGLLTSEEQKKVDALQHRKPINVVIN